MRTKEQVLLEIEKLQEELEELEKEGVWQPEKGDTYWRINQFGAAAKETNCGFEIDKRTLACFNYFKTKEDAEKAAKAENLYRAMWHWNKNNDNGYKFDTKRTNHSIEFNCEYLKYGVAYSKYYECNTQVYFSTEDKAQACLEWLISIGLIDEKQ